MLLSKSKNHPLVLAHLLVGLTHMCLSAGSGTLVSVPQSTGQNSLSHSLLMAVSLSQNAAGGNQLRHVRCVSCCLKGNPHQQLFLDVVSPLGCSRRAGVNVQNPAAELRS